ncbi:MAG: type I-C CRISPR-associated protein Cas8c/Csd1, partial [Bacteroidota bacterium]
SLTGHETYRKRAVHWFIELDNDGNYLGFIPSAGATYISKGKSNETRGKIFVVPCNYHAQIKNGEINGVCTNQHNWLPDFLTYPANELFLKGVYGDLKVEYRKRKDSWVTIFKAKQDLPKNKNLVAVINYLRSRPKFPDKDLPNGDNDEKDRLLKRFYDGYERISFRVNGKIVFLDEEIKKWWISRTEKTRNEVVSLLPEGSDFYLSGQGKLAEFFPVVFNNIPFASFDKEPFKSYGLGKQTTPLRIETSEKAAAAINWMLADENYNIVMGDITAIFWARNNNSVNSTGFVSLISKSDSMEVKDFLNNIWGHQQPNIEESDFYAVLIAPKRGRFSIYSWHTETLRNAEGRLKSYFQTIAIPLNGEYTTFSISELAGVTVRKGKNSSPLPNTYVSLFETALFGLSLPYKLFKAVLIRQGVEMAKGVEEKNEFEKRLAGRTAVVKLFLFKKPKGENMEEEKHDVENNPGYLCGRLLAILDKIHQDAHRQSGGTNNSPANRVYSVASKTPALIFPRLFDLARHHLNKIGGGLAYNLEFGIPKEKRKDGIDSDWEGLAEICKRLKDTASSGFPRMLSLEDQGRFAIGFYYERELCKKLPETKSKDNADQNVQENQKEESQ